MEGLLWVAKIRLGKVYLTLLAGVTVVSTVLPLIVPEKTRLYCSHEHPRLGGFTIFKLTKLDIGSHSGSRLDTFAQRNPDLQADNDHAQHDPVENHEALRSHPVVIARLHTGHELGGEPYGGG